MNNKLKQYLKGFFPKKNKEPFVLTYDRVKFFKERLSSQKESLHEKDEFLVLKQIDNKKDINYKATLRVTKIDKPEEIVEKHAVASCFQEYIEKKRKEIINSIRISNSDGKKKFNFKANASVKYNAKEIILMYDCIEEVEMNSLLKVLLNEKVYNISFMETIIHEPLRREFDISPEIY